MEDIINRGGGNLIVKVYPRTGGNRLDESSPVLVSRDGCNERLPAGSAIRLKPGESITLYSGLYHSFWAEEGCGKVLIGEVSSVNDDRADNRFLEETGRFPKIEEDEPPLYLMSMDY
jgi:D-lyxose ketol-isomerase